MTKAYTITLSLLLLSPALSASSQTSQEADARKAADAAFEQKRWVDAERAYLAYSRRQAAALHTTTRGLCPICANIRLNYYNA